MYWMVKEFHEAFNHPVSEKPIKLDVARVVDRYKWILEEIDEFKEAQTLVDQVDALIDTLYLTIGTLVEMGVKPYTPFKIVQNANMSKLFPDGKPRYKDDGKIMKPDTFISPEPLLEKEISRQGK
ncbi:HAD family hydrolase [Alkalihalophilus pseudofirmus]|uniref:HAD family hydrolase n=1 Tax=Alkalihalophilus pseudofirmus TaxID=79885 RepID=UPI00259BB62E|nr:HAD family hydrolase [Alkalihalophilus pseudofirmus]WEG19061.1 HAD family hydrolase [Alkalihalophilus pseudofirmus]